jgi:hypothetical protein
MSSPSGIAFVYFLRPIGMRSPIKIGVSSHPITRLFGLLAWSPFKLEIIATAPGCIGTEGWLHQKFRPLHSHSEWFNQGADLWALIQEIQRRGVVPNAPTFIPQPLKRAQKRLFPLAGLMTVLGKHGVSLEDFATAAGVSTARVRVWPTIYNHGAFVGRAAAGFEALGLIWQPNDLARIEDIPPWAPKVVAVSPQPEPEASAA